MKFIAGYKVIKLLAKGGMSAIYLAEQTSLKRQVVLKLLNPKLNEKIKKRFIDEGRIIASLKHPNIITVFDVVSSGKYNFLSMEYLPDGDLESRLAERSDTYFTLNVISKISEALHVIHKQGIIHGDIKPANILFRGKDCPLLTDFGISHQIEPKKEVDSYSDELYASPSYASPELIQGMPFDYRTDIYSLGIMMYEMLMGEKPFKGETDLETIANSIQLPVPQLSEELSELQPLLNSLLAKAPEERLSDAKLVTRFITHYLKEHPHLKNTSSETKLIDTDVVVEYLSKKKTGQKTKTVKYFSLIILLFMSIFIYLNNELFLGNSPPSVSVQKKLQEADTPSIAEPESIINNAEQLKLREQAFLEQQKQLEKKLLLEQQAALEKKNREIAQVKQELEEQKNKEIEQVKRELERQKKSSKQSALSEKKSQASILLKKGRASLKKYNLTTPLNDNALYYFQKVLEIDKNNKKAQQGIEDVVYRYELLARSALDKYQYQKAQHFISIGLTVDSDNKRLLELQKEANLHSEPGRVVKKVKNFFKNL